MDKWLLCLRAESVTENRYRDVGIEKKTKKPKTDENIPKKTKICFLLMTACKLINTRF